MTRGRVVAVVLVGGCLLGAGGAGARAEHESAPGVNDLRLQVERLERAEHAQVVGNEASALLFDPGHRAAAQAAAEARRLAHGGVTAGLFLQGSAPSWTPAPTEHLFAARDDAPATAARTVEAGTGDDGSPVALLAAGALAAAGAGASGAVRGRGVRAGG